MIFRQHFKITGVPSDIAYDSGVTSTESEKKRILSVWAILNGHADNQLQSYHEKAKVFDIPDRLLDVETDSFDYAYAKPGARINEIDVGLELPVGQTFKVAIKCGATNKDVYGCYNYELMS